VVAIEVRDVDGRYIKVAAKGDSSKYKKTKLQK
jgi:hypothetical protein